MTMHTRCTHCAAVFRVTLRQLQSSSGQVRCGVCHEAFDAFVHLRAAEGPEDNAAPSRAAPPVEQESGPVEVVPSQPVVETPAPRGESIAAPVDIAPPANDPTGTADVAEAAFHEIPAAFESIDIELVADPPGSAPRPVEELVSEPPSAIAPEPPSAIAPEPPSAIAPEPSSAIAPEPSSAIAPEPSTSFEPATVPASEAEPPAPIAMPARAAVRRPRRWPLMLGVALLLLVLLIQVAYRFRTRITTAVPALRPAAERVCELAGCRVPLPELSDRLVIETSDLRALDPARPNRVVLIATVRNTAPVAQAHPFVELSFTDARDQVIARKVLAPQDYLDAPVAVSAGIGPHGDVGIRMQLDVGDLEVSGYRLYLFHR